MKKTTLRRELEAIAAELAERAKTGEVNIYQLIHRLEDGPVPPAIQAAIDKHETAPAASPAQSWLLDYFMAGKAAGLLPGAPGDLA